MTNYPMSLDEFNHIYSKVPRLTVEIILKKSGAIYLTQRAIEPCAGQWHLPGGTVYFGERLLEAITRVAQQELSISVKQAELKGYIEYPSHYKKGLDSPVGMVFEVTSYDGEPVIDEEASAGDWFISLPEHMHADQDIFLVREGYLTK